MKIAHENDVPYPGRRHTTVERAWGLAAMLGAQHLVESVGATTDIYYRLGMAVVMEHEPGNAHIAEASSAEDARAWGLWLIGKAEEGEIVLEARLVPGKRWVYPAPYPCAEEGGERW